MEPEHTYFLPGRELLVGALRDDERVVAFLRDLWAKHGHPNPGPFDGVSFLPHARRARLCVSRDGEFNVFDVEETP